ncbi:MAG TPA: hypothetical protein VLC74_05325 [Rhizomicrobium sp.]|nr:hypothetical protein [Rhizomicrobium sp.]
MRFQNLFAAGAVVALGSMVPHANAAVSVLGNGLGNGCFQSAEFGGDPRPAIETCTAALEQEALTPKDRAATYVNRGILRSRYGDSRGALSDYNQGIAIDASLGEAYVDRGANYIVLQQYQDALNDINKGIGMGAHRLEIAYYDRAIVNEALGNVRAAYYDYKKAVELEPDFALANEQLSRFKIVRHEADQ